MLGIMKNIQVNQGTWIGVLALLLCPIPLLGIAASLIIQRSLAYDTNANTCAMISTVLAVIFTIIYAILGTLSAFVMLCLAGFSL